MFTITKTDTPDGSCVTAVHDVEVDWSDQTGWFDPSKIDTAVTIVGCGGIGSNVAFELITMGFKRFVLYDDDVVEMRNLASQKAYRHSDLFRPKVEALADVLFEYGAEKVLLRQRRFTADDVIEGSIIIGAVDSMSSRRAIWAAVQASPEVELYLDGRLDSEVAQICAVDPLDANWYESRWLFSDEEASQTGNCTMRVIVYPATVMAGVMCRHLSRWYQGEPITQFVQFDCTNLELMKLGDIEE
ncbi:MAG TPA: ThiF family adenylyltransferase [Candidatus Saccharimonas sp.]|nr:ThiF family adenylyltransferase [Candidatus Saccharimonas sp.]